MLRPVKIVLASVLVAGSAVSRAQEPTVESLLKKLAQRDLVIQELLERVEALERRVGMSHSGSSPRDSDEHAHAEEDKAEASEGNGTASDTGATRAAPGRVVVDEEAAERALERSLTQVGALLLRPGQLELEPRLVYQRNEDDTPAFVDRDGSTFAGQRERNVDGLTGDLTVRLGLPRDAQLEIGIPYRWRDVETVTNVGFAAVDQSSQGASGLGDLRLGVAKTILRENIWRPDLVGRITWDTKTGEREDDGVSLGSGFDEIRASLTAVNRQDPIVFLGALSYEQVFEDDDIQPGATIASSLGGFIALSPETSLRLIVSGAYQQEAEVSGSLIDGSDQVAASFIVGGSTLLFPGAFLNVSTGIGLTDDADDFSFSLSIPIRLNPPLF